MSDISFHYTWWELLLASPIIGWPGAILGGALGALALKGRRRILGGIGGAIVGNVLWAFAAIYFK